MNTRFKLYTSLYVLTSVGVSYFSLQC